MRRKKYMCEWCGERCAYYSHNKGKQRKHCILCRWALMELFSNSGVDELKVKL